MFRTLTVLLLAALVWVVALAAPNAARAEFQSDPPAILPDNAYPVVVFETSLGTVEVELDRRRAPATVNNFLAYVVAGDFDNTIFHRIIEGFVVQGGGFDENWDEVTTRAPVMNESGNGLRNDAWTIAMARYDDPHSATSQFFFNVADNNDALDPNPKHWGYAVFGMVVSGRDVLEALAAVPTGYNAELDYQDVPLTPVKLIKVSVQ
ncbi:MAG: peptidylprolyl isomerase [Xanthomonadales bacterium]|jgi:peptidyl-prolyl cis-trans isomerase A (cyclophilin A)|nr:peptidylprolyl isomerase [Xanthomonadales bacterium]